MRDNLSDCALFDAVDEKGGSPFSEAHSVSGIVAGLVRGQLRGEGQQGEGRRVRFERRVDEWFITAANATP
jgi:hypothetical protein